MESAFNVVAFYPEEKCVQVSSVCFAEHCSWTMFVDSCKQGENSVDVRRHQSGGLLSARLQSHQVSCSRQFSGHVNPVTFKLQRWRTCASAFVIVIDCLTVRSPYCKAVASHCTIYRLTSIIWFKLAFKDIDDFWSCYLLGIWMCRVSPPRFQSVIRGHRFTAGFLFVSVGLYFVMHISHFVVCLFTVSQFFFLSYAFFNKYLLFITHHLSDTH